MPASRRTSSTDGPPQPRQLPGSACEECRKRKLRCDRQRPQCGTCADAGIVCEVNHNRLARGPKKGDLKALRSRIVALERRLSLDPSNLDALSIHGDADLSQQHALPAGSTPPPPPPPGPASSDGDLSQLPSPRGGRGSIWDGDYRAHNNGQLSPMTPQIPLSMQNFKFPPSPPTPPKRPLIHDLMRADLDQLYFDRVHPNVPIFNQSRYFALSHHHHHHHTSAPSPRLCLQYAMWTLAMALSSQFESYRDTLYTETKQMLESLDMCENTHPSHESPVCIEEIQAWLLLAFYEFSRTNYKRGWVTAGRAFRLVQLARLHEIDSPERAMLQQGEDPVVVEERRRTFWVAYCLDRFISLKNQWPLTLMEEVICTHLPSPELSFQSGQPIQMCFLSEAMASGDHLHGLFSPLAESVVLATVCGRTLSHTQVANVERTYNGSTMSADSWIRHEWLAAMVNKRLDSLVQSYPVVSAAADPMLFFAFMLAHTTTINLCKVVEAGGGHSQGSNGQWDPAVFEYQKRALRAAREIATLTKAHEHLGYFKAHIFLPVSISLAASRLISQRTQVLADLAAQVPEGFLATTDTEFDKEIQSCMDALGKMQTFNNLAREHLHALEIVQQQQQQQHQPQHQQAQTPLMGHVPSQSHSYGHTASHSLSVSHQHQHIPQIQLCTY
ncbi:fungal-specific transcription factor domain-containing protein [Pseudoneurospora amorphoporcata]|uniref:Fungal-specific transcription factor domain-containing protein n=1 Tax=Pseudoneurospora amorphoporcata TaxID=241081 RepID=A0AAN6NT06_9PEZI|nr:fungal-specific transcription factor domain-containing protein [Pseudoneurospora amorphoporcata]